MCLAIIESYNLDKEIIDSSKMINSLDELITLHLGDIIVVDVQSFTKHQELIAGVS